MADIAEPELIRRVVDEDGDERQVHLYVREFLNLPGFHSTALILAEVSEDKYGVNLDFTLSDCSRQINLSLDVWSDAARNNTRHKLNLLVDTLIEFRKHAFDALDRVAEKERQKKEGA